MTKEKIIEYRKQILEERKAFTDKQDEEWTKKLREFEDANVPFKIGQVIELPKAKKYKRMAIYKIRTMFWDNDIMMIMLHGWYLNKDNVPVKWEGAGLTVYGVSNPVEIVLSENQTHLPVQEDEGGIK